MYDTPLNFLSDHTNDIRQHVYLEQEEKKKEEDDEEVRTFVTTIKNLTGLWDDDPEDSEYVLYILYYLHAVLELPFQIIFSLTCHFTFSPRGGRTVVGGNLSFVAINYVPDVSQPYYFVLVWFYLRSSVSKITYSHGKMGDVT